MSTIEVDKIIPQSGTDTQLGESGDTITIPAGATITNNGTATGFDTDTNDKVKVSTNDTTPGFLNGKLVAGTNISLTEGSDGGNETLTAALSGTIGTSQIADDSITLAKLTATGTKDATTFLRGDNTFASAGESNKPYFVAKMTAVQQSITDGALYTINNYNSVNVDTCSGFDTSTGRYTPNVAGYYYVSFQTHATTSGGNMKMCYGQIFKNGSGGSGYSERAINQITFNTSFGEGANVGVENLIYLNGSSDYVYTAVVGDTNSGSAPAIAGESNYTWFRAFLVAAT